MSPIVGALGTSDKATAGSGLVIRNFSLAQPRSPDDTRPALSPIE